MEHEATDFGRQIIDTFRKARLGTTSLEEWTRRLETFLRAQPDLREPIRIINLRAPEGGAGSSSGTMFLTAEVGTDNGVTSKDYVFRFTPAEPLFHVYDLSAQVRIQRALARSDVPVPRQCWEDIPGRYLTVPGYIMECAKGEGVPGAWFGEGIIAEASPEQRRTLVMSFIHTLARIHAIDWRESGLSFLLDRAAGDGLIAREINWYWDAFLWADEAEGMKRFAGIRQWLLDNQPAYRQAVLCHGDANFTNNLFDQDGVSAVLDWEMAFIGTPECDIAYAVNGMMALTIDFPPGTPTADEMFAEYERVSGTPLEHMDYYRLFAMYRNVVIHVLGLRTFQAEAFEKHVEALVAQMMDHARTLGAA